MPNFCLGIVASGVVDLPVKTGLMFWLDASDPTTITSSGGYVSQWNDKSTNAWHVTQATLANRPQTGVSTINNRNVVRFGATASQVLTNFSNSLFQNTQFEEIFIVLRQSSVVGEQRPFSKAVVSGNSRTLVSINRNSTGNLGKFEFIGKAPDTSANYGFISTTGLTTTTRLFNAKFNFSAGGGYIKINNGAAETTVGTGLTVPPAGLTTSNAVGESIGIGGNPSSATQVMKGDIAEIIVFQRNLTTDETSQITAYLNSKWAIY